MPDRRSFLTRVALLVTGAVMLPSVIVSNSLVHADDRYRPSIGRKQRDLLAACQNVAKRMGVFRDGTNIWHYANDGEIEMTWTMVLPPEHSIDENTAALAQQLNSLAQT
ncbi:MAG TPA: hypothetical protein VJZ75_11225 [Candidatus Bathyarchaeia archaeon]|nr:hypothetical protein [Candidatus Bathyarchaeia archaeon]